MHFPFYWDLRVRYAEVDAQGIVFNAHYLTYFDTALTEYMRALDYDYKDMLARHNLDFHLVKSLVEYRQPVFFDDELRIGVRVGRLGRTSIQWLLGVFRKGEEACLATGEIVWVCARPASFQAHPLPEDFRERLSRC